MSRCWRAETTIEASPEEVWSVMVDFAAYPSWNPFTREVRTTPTVGAVVRMRVDLGWVGVIPQAEIVRAVEPGRRLAWAMDQWPRWLIHARRDQTLEPQPDGRTRYVTEDRISGALLPVVAWLFGAAMQRGFERCADALGAEVGRRRALAGSAPR